MDHARAAQMILRYETGLLTAHEVAHAVLYDLVNQTDLDMAFVSSLGAMPDEVAQAFYSLMERIRQAGFRWTPFLISASTEAIEPTAYSAKLRRIWESLAESSEAPQFHSSGDRDGKGDKKGEGLNIPHG